MKNILREKKKLHGNDGILIILFGWDEISF